MSRRRRIYLLMALLPTALGVATFAIVDRSERSQDEAWLPAMTGFEAAPEVVQEAQSVSAPTDRSVEVSDTAPATKEAEAPATAPQAPASNQRPIRDDADEAQAPALFADSGPTESASSEGPIRFASIGSPYAGGGGGGGSGGNKDPQTPKDPQDQPGDDTPADTGKDQPDQSQGGNSPGTNPPKNDDGKQDQGGPSQGGPNPENPNEQTPVDEGDDDGTPPFIPDPEEKPVQVPEPATLGLFALGLLGCAARRKARK